MKSLTSRHTNTPKNRNEAVKGRICQLLGWNEMQYAEFQYDMGIAYLRYYLPFDLQGIDLLVSDKMFWAWWRCHWLNRDEQFIYEQAAIPRIEMARIYTGLNDPATLAGEIYPDGVVLGDCFAKIINELK